VAAEEDRPHHPGAEVSAAKSTACNDIAPCLAEGAPWLLATQDRAESDQLNNPTESEGSFANEVDGDYRSAVPKMASRANGMPSSSLLRVVHRAAARAAAVPDAIAMP
jgi:hypothetical protein